MMHLLTAKHSDYASSIRKKSFKMISRNFLVKYLLFLLGVVSHAGMAMAFHTIFPIDPRLENRVHASQAWCLFATPQKPTERLGLGDRFGRWRYLQKILDEEADAAEVNEMVYWVLQDYVTDEIRRRGEAGSPEMTVQLKRAIENLLEESSNGMIPVLSPNESQQLLSRIESVLPDPAEDEDGHKSTWDLVMELHGREGVKLNEQEGRLGWKQSCLAARVLLYYDFLTRDTLD